ncbi:putative T7SS-secreted protein, partial [Streptomyces sp. ME19-01-6]|uniref:putative T7SS-secreted protein n=1 Tax=Streptomyces sp. ME19-01-6 TaxID=3028686 RepID=UPI0029ADFD82
MGIGDFIPDPAKHFVGDQVENAGEIIDWAGYSTADRLDDIGWDGGADWVRDKTDSAANVLGADVAELDLDRTEDPKKLVHGSPGKLRSTADHLTTFQKAFNDVAKGLKGVGPDSLKGESAAAFTEKVSTQPKKWYAAADACEKAAGALREFAETVEWAQKQADEAIRAYRKGKKASQEARAGHDAEVSAYNDAVTAYNATPADRRDPGELPDRPGAFHDPGSAGMEAAQDILAEARRQRDVAHRAARQAVEAARDKAPAKPSYLKRAGDGLDGLRLDGQHFLGGVVKGTAGLVGFARSMNPLDPYNLAHPAEYATHVNATAAGLLQMANDPQTALKGMWHSFEQDPAEGLGRLVPELVGTKGLGGLRSFATAGKDLAKIAEQAPGKGWRGKFGGHRQVAEEGAAQHSVPDAAKTSGGTDPVDLATGKMFLPQTDVSLPGLLPLVFSRRAESGYRAGRW